VFQPGPGLHVDDDGPVGGWQQMVGHVPAPLAVDGGRQRERLGDDLGDRDVEVGVQQVRQLKP
jgi:hypothetical protein